MIIENWSLIKENSNNEYCLVIDSDCKFVKGNLENDSKISSSIITSSIVCMNYYEAKCEKDELYKLGYVNRDYHRYIQARYNEIGIISDWFLYYENNRLKIKAKLSKNQKEFFIKDFVIDYDPIKNEIDLENNNNCFLITDSINEYAKQILLANGKFVNIVNHKIKNINEYIIDINSIECVDQKVEENKVKILHK